MTPKEFTKLETVQVVYTPDGMHIKEEDVYGLMQKYAYKKFLLYRVMCRFGFHKWTNLRKDIPNPKDGEMICWTALHKCDVCGKEEEKGMGCIV